MATGESPHVPHWEYPLVMKKSGTDDSAVPFSSTGSSPFKVRSVNDIAPGKPVLTATQVTVWEALRLAGVAACGDRAGSLFAPRERTARSRN